MLLLFLRELDHIDQAHSANLVSPTTFSRCYYNCSKPTLFTMSDELLLRDVAGRLGYSCQNSSSCSGNEEEQLVVENSGDTSDIVGSAITSSLSYPSFSLTHQHHNHHQPVDASSPSREEVQLKASACMAQQVRLQKGESKSNDAFQDVPCRMLENILDSFDHLVDARLHQYSKVLRNHGQSLSTAGQQIVEYKLRTLLEIGTSISFGKISTKFTATNEEAKTTEDSTTTVTELPITLTVEIDSLQFHPPTQQQQAQQQQEQEKISFSCSGKIQGTQLACFDRDFQYSLHGSLFACCLMTLTLFWVHG